MRPQRDLFALARAYPDGLVYEPDFLDANEEAALLAQIAALPVTEAKYRGFVARRRTMHFGFGYDFTSNRLQPAPALPAFLVPLRERVARWAGVAAEAFEQGLVTEYRPGTPPGRRRAVPRRPPPPLGDSAERKGGASIGWHRDVPQFGVVAGISLQSVCRMRFRPYPPAADWVKQAFTLDLAPRSAYLLKDAIRWAWQHSIPDVRSLRWSITFRTMRHPSQSKDHDATKT